MDSHNIRRRNKPRENENLFSRLFFCWTIPIFIKGCKKDLDENDLNGPLKDHDSHALGLKLEEAWINEKAKGRSSLTRAIWKVFGIDIFCYGILLFVIEFGAKLAYPIYLGKLMQYYIPDQTSVSKEDAVIYGSFIVLASFINVFLGHNYMMGTQHLGMKIRVACTSLVYRKCLKLNKSTMVVFNTGKVINMLANDLGRFDNIFLSFYNIWAAPIQIIVVTCLLYFLIGIRALAGIGFFILFIPVQIFLGKLTSKYRLKTALNTDERVRFMKEIITAIQVIKMYSWEEPFIKLAQLARTLEIKHIRSSSMIRAINASVSIFLNRTALYFAVLAYILAGNAPRAYYIFVVSSFYNVLRQPLVFHIPQAISSLAEAAISVKRIEDFLVGENVESVPSKFKDNRFKTTGIFLHNVSAKWNLSEENILTDVNFSARKKELVTIVGPVGSGKSTLFQVILKELAITTGVLDVSGTISYASQESWLFAGSIKENILFGEQYDPKRYQEVCRVCALDTDFSFLPLGDETTVGDRGITLSGGQKARINLARAVYKAADIYLLDDPLSAVDMHVGKHLYKSCIVDFLKDKCVVLITHQIQYLTSRQKIFVIKNSLLESCDTIEQFDSTDKLVLPILDCQQIESSEGDNNAKQVAQIKNKVEAKEQKQKGAIEGRVYGQYFGAGGNYFVLFIIVFLFIAAQFFASSVDYFLTLWVNFEEINLNKTQKEFSLLYDVFRHKENCLYLYSLLIFLTISLTILRSTSFMQFCMNASKKLYHKMLVSVINTCMNFFYVNSSGTILNRFSKDIGLIDEVLPLIILETVQVFCNLISITILIAVINPWIAIPSVILLVVFYWLKLLFLTSSQNLKRMEATARSPVYTHISDSLQGSITIRAFGAQDYAIREFETKQNVHNSAFYLFMACNRTFGFWLDFLCVLYVGIVIMSILLMLDDTTGGNVGLAITQSLALTGMLQWGIRQWSEMQNQMTAVERVVEYSDLEPEDSGNNKNKKSMDWLISGKIQFKNVSLRYSTNEPFVLHNVNVTINSNEKIGIVGRTGAGKSSLAAALFRLVGIEGTIFVDDTDISTLPLHLLRSKISIIPQEPLLLRGTLRSNLDPFDEYEDEQLWAALKEVEMNNVAEELPGGLYSKVHESGSNFSVGQKQLLCIARALIRNNRILILDEATSSVDSETDELIQRTIKKKFEKCTFIVIAHRLRTIMDSDKVIVVDAGSVIEFDHPYILLQNRSSEFYRLLTKTEESEVEDLLSIAEENYKKHERVNCDKS